MNLVKPLRWQEVPEAQFLSWSEARQLDYCLRRDLASAEDPEAYDIMGRDWFLDRASGYKEELNNLLKKGKI